MIAAALFVSAVLYSAWILEYFLNNGIDPVHAYTSELAAYDQPFGWLFRLCDLVAGILVVVASVLGLKRSGNRLMWTALVVFGSATALDSQWALSCAPSGDDACAAAEDAGTVPLTHTLHTVSSSAASAAALVAVAAFAWSVRSDGLLGRVAVGAAIALGVATVWTVAAISLNSTVGLAQRVQVLLFVFSLVILAVTQHRARKCST